MAEDKDHDNHPDTKITEEIPNDIDAYDDYSDYYEVEDNDEYHEYDKDINYADYENYKDGGYDYSLPEIISESEAERVTSKRRERSGRAQI